MYMLTECYNSTITLIITILFIMLTKVINFIIKDNYEKLLLFIIINVSKKINIGQYFLNASTE